MKKAIEFLRSKNVIVSEAGIIIERSFPVGLDGAYLTGELEELTFDEENECCYTIIIGRLTKINC